MTLSKTFWNNTVKNIKYMSKIIHFLNYKHLLSYYYKFNDRNAAHQEFLGISHIQSGTRYTGSVYSIQIITPTRVH